MLLMIMYGNNNSTLVKVPVLLDCFLNFPAVIQEDPLQSLEVINVCFSDIYCGFLNQLENLKICVFLT